MNLVQNLFLNYVRIKLRHIPNINRGGCGIAVLAVYMFLKKWNKLPESFQVVTLYSDIYGEEHNYETNSNFINNNSSKAAPCSHFAFMIDNHIMDCNETLLEFKIEKMLVVPQDKTETFLRTAINTYGWNTSFNRTKYIPIINKMLKIKLS